MAPELQEEMKLGLLEAGMARRLLGLPRGNQLELATVARRAALGVGQTETLVQRWRRAPSAEARQFVLTHPREAIAQAPSPPPDPRLSAQGQSVQRRLQAVLRAMTALTEALGRGLEAQDQPRLQPDLEALSLLMSKMSCRLGPSSASES